MNNAQEGEIESSIKIWQYKARCLKAIDFGRLMPVAQAKEGKEHLFSER